MTITEIEKKYIKHNCGYIISEPVYADYICSSGYLLLINGVLCIDYISDDEASLIGALRRHLICLSDRRFFRPKECTCGLYA